MTAAQTLAIVHSLLDNMKAVMDGESSCLANSTCTQTVVYVGGESSTKAIRQTLGTFCHGVRISVPRPYEDGSCHARGCKRD